jgi:hypothetical protein
MPINDSKGCVAGLEKFYIDLADTAKEQGYSIDFIKAEASPCKEHGEPLCLDELRNVYGNDLPLDWKWRFDFFLEDRDCLRKAFRALGQKGYQIAFDFEAPDVFLGNIVLCIDHKWFAIGECKRNSPILPWNTNDKSPTGYFEIETMRLWSPFYVLLDLKPFETHWHWYSR